LQYSKIHDNHTMGWTSATYLCHPGQQNENQTGTGHNTIRGNYIWNNTDEDIEGRESEGHGVIADLCNSRFREFSGNLIENNVIWDNEGHCINVFSSDNVTVRNNTCIGNGLGRPGTGEISSIGWGNKIHNNILLPREPRLALYLRENPEFADSLKTNELDANLMWSPVHEDVVGVRDAKGMHRLTVEQYRDVNEFGWGAAALFADPLLDEDDGYAPLAGSPAIDSSDPSYASKRDIRSLPRPLDGNGDGEKAVDRGAYEMQRPLVDTPGKWVDASLDGDVEVVWTPKGHKQCGPNKDEHCWSWRVVGRDTKCFDWSDGFRDGPMQCDIAANSGSFVLGTKPHTDFMVANLVNVGGSRGNVLDLTMLDDDPDSQFKSRMEYSCNNWDSDWAPWNSGGYIAYDLKFPEDQHEMSCNTPTGWCWRSLGEVYAINEGEATGRARITYGIVRPKAGAPWYFRIGSNKMYPPTWSAHSLVSVWNYVSKDPVPAGEWFRFEYQFTPDSGIGTKDGTVKMWIDGELVFDVVGATWMGKRTWDMFGVYTATPGSRQRIDNILVCQSRECSEDPKPPVEPMPPILE
jgi:parallel beta-helix repeat protein